MDVLISRYKHNRISELLLRVNGFAFFSHYVYLLKNKDHNSSFTTIINTFKPDTIFASALLYHMATSLYCSSLKADKLLNR